jgi:hypothetical protein
MNFDAKVRALLGREPSKDELARLQRLQSTLQIRDNDALFSVLIAFEEYLHLYSDVPKLIESAAHRARDVSAKSANDAVNASVASAKQDLARSIEVAVRSATQSTGALRLRWVLQGAAAALCALVFTFVVAWFAAKDVGRAEALSEAHGLEVWAETPEGRAAKAWADSGELGAMLRCDRPGWNMGKNADGANICLPGADRKKGQFGWVLPFTAAR